MKLPLELSEQQRNQATMACRLLHEANVVPGMHDAGKSIRSDKT